MTKFSQKTNQYNQWMLSIEILLIVFVMGIALISAQNVEYAVEVGQCNIDADKAYLSLQFNHDYYLELGNLRNNARQAITDEPAVGEWFADGKVFIYDTINPDTRYTSYLFDIETNQSSEILEPPAGGWSYPSPDGRYLLNSLLKSGLPSTQDTVFDRVENKLVFNEEIEYQAFVGWSPQGRYMTYRGVEGGIDAVFDITTNQYLNLPFLNRSTKIVGWVDGEHFVYRDEDGELIIYAVQTQASEHHVKGVYPSDWLTSSNLYPYYMADKWMGMKDDEDRLWVIDIVNRNRIDIDFVNYLYGDISIVGDVLYMSDYNFPEQIELIELRNNYRLRLDYVGTRYPPVARSGNYFASPERDVNGLILYVQDFRTGERVNIDLAYPDVVFDYFYWIQVGGQDYLYFVQPIDDNPDVYLHYLYYPETRETCLVTASQYERLVWQP